MPLQLQHFVYFNILYLRELSIIIIIIIINVNLHSALSSSQWLNYSKVGGDYISFSPFPPFLFFPLYPSVTFPLFLSPPFSFSPVPSLLLELGPLNPAKGLMSAVSSPSGIWGEAQGPAEIEFGAF